MKKLLLLPIIALMFLLPFSGCTAGESTSAPEPDTVNEQNDENGGENQENPMPEPITPDLKLPPELPDNDVISPRPKLRPRSPHKKPKDPSCPKPIEMPFDP